MGGGAVVVIGGGPAAGALVHGLRRGGHEGTVTVLAEEGRPPYDRTALSKGLLTGSVQEPPTLFPDALAAAQIHPTRAQAIDRSAGEVQTADGRVLPYDHLVLATGAAPRVPPIPGLAVTSGGRVHVLRDAVHGVALAGRLQPGRRLVVIGAGLIGMEVAAAARALGVEVVVLDAAPVAMGRVLPHELSTALVDHLAGEGARVHLGAPPTGVDAHGDQVVVTGHDGAEWTADHLLVATGVSPRTDLAAAAGLAVDDGVLVDELLTTQDPAVMAIGDVARVRSADGTSTRTEAYTPAMAMGQHAARTLLGEPTPYREVPWAWSDQGELTVQVAGWPDRVDRWVLRGSADDLVVGLYAFGLAGDVLVATAGVSRGRAVGRVVRGAQQALAAGLDVSDVDLTDPDVDLRRLARTG